MVVPCKHGVRTPRHSGEENNLDLTHVLMACGYQQIQLLTEADRNENYFTLHMIL